jgi:hypothetical protein
MIASHQGTNPMTQHQAPEVTSEPIACPGCGAKPVTGDEYLAGIMGRAEPNVVCMKCEFSAPSITAWNTRATQPLSLTVETKASPSSAAFDVLDWLRDNREDIIDRLQSLSLPVGDEAIERAAKALYADWVAEDFNEEYCAWEQLPDKETWCRRARAALGEQIAENANCSGDIDRSGLAQEVE